MATAGSSIGGYDYKFVDTPPDRLVCKICHLPSRQAFLTTCCGHIFCKSCLDFAKKTTTLRGCPVCRDEEFISYTNKQADREIKGLYVMCPNKERGCEWQGVLSNVNDHLRNSDGCQFEDVQCTNDCGKTLQRQYMASHVKAECVRRKVNCQYCHTLGEHQHIEGDHQEQCPKYPLSCPNKCDVGIISREDMEAHRIVCPFEEVECVAKCGMILQRQYLTDHVENVCLFRMINCQYCHVMGEYQFIEGKHKEQCPRLPLPCPNKCGMESIPLEVMEAHKKKCPLEVIRCEYHNVGSEETMMRKDFEKHENEKVKEHLLLTKSKSTTTEQNLHETQQKQSGTLQKLSLRELQLTATCQQLSTELADTKAQLTSALEQINSLTILVHQAAISNGNTSGSILSATKWWAKLTAMAVVSGSGDQVCPVIMKVPEYTKKKTGRRDWYSASFYTHDKGYKMCLHIYAAGAGTGKNSHLSVFLYVMKGPYDENLTWPLKGEFELKLLNQISETYEHFSTTVTYDDHTPLKSSGRVAGKERADNGWGKHKFFSHEDLCKVTPTQQYLKDDLIYLQVDKL